MARGALFASICDKTCIHVYWRYCCFYPYEYQLNSPLVKPHNSRMWPVLPCLQAFVTKHVLAILLFFPYEYQLNSPLVKPHNSQMWPVLRCLQAFVTKHVLAILLFLSIRIPTEFAPSKASQFPNVTRSALFASICDKTCTGDTVVFIHMNNNWISPSKASQFPNVTRSALFESIGGKTCTGDTVVFIHTNTTWIRPHCSQASQFPNVTR